MEFISLQSVRGTTHSEWEHNSGKNGLDFKKIPCNDHSIFWTKICDCDRHKRFLLVIAIRFYFQGFINAGSVVCLSVFFALHWCHNDHDGVSNHQPHGCLLNRLFKRRSKKTSKLRVTGLCVGNSPGPVNSPHKGPVTRKMFPFDDVIMSDASLALGWLWRRQITVMVSRITG